MNISFTVELSSSGDFTPGVENVNRWVGTSSWQNQYGSGRFFEVNLIWLSLLIEYSRQKKTRPVFVGVEDE